MCFFSFRVHFWVGDTIGEVWRVHTLPTCSHQTSQATSSQVEFIYTAHNCNSVCEGFTIRTIYHILSLRLHWLRKSYIGKDLRQRRNHCVCSTDATILELECRETEAQYTVNNCKAAMLGCFMILILIWPKFIYLLCGLVRLDCTYVTQEAFHCRM